jgi:hypothetical protein
MSEDRPSYDGLLEVPRAQPRQIAALTAEVARLQAELDEARRAAKRQAAPFAKRPPKAHPKRPGRKPGHPPAHRPPPAPGQVDRRVVAPLPADCPDCGEPLPRAPADWHNQYPIDLPPPRPVTTRFRVEVRPAVIARELSAGNRTEEGAETPSVLARVPRTCRRQGKAILGALTDLARHGPVMSSTSSRKRHHRPGKQIRLD